MGCWSETCGITQLPINAGDKVRLFILFENYLSENKGGGSCYPNDIWAPLGLPIQGVYDDYGGIEDIIENQDTEILFSRMKKGWVTFIEEYESVSPLASMSLQEAVHWIERGKAKISLYDEERELGIMFVLEEVYQTMIKFNPIKCHHINDTYEYKPFKDILKYNLKLSYDKRYHRFFPDINETGVCEHINSLQLLSKNNIPFDNELVQELSNSLLEMKTFHHSMMLARKSYAPQSGKGSQNNEISIYKDLISTMSKIIENKENLDREDGFSLDENGYAEYMIEQNLKNKNTSK